MNKGLWGLSLFLLIAGLAALCTGLIMAWHRRKHQVRRGRVLASVVDLELREDGSGPYRGRYYPVFEYYAQGQLYKTVYPEGSYPSAWKVGDRVWISFDPARPQDYELTQTGFHDSVPQMIYGAGIAMVVLSALLFLAFARR